MKKKYIQLPPLPSDLPLESIELIWLYAGMPQQEKQIFQEFMCETLKDSTKEFNQTELNKVKNDSGNEADSDIARFTSLMQSLIGTLIVQACEMAAIVYQYYHIEGKSVEEISKTIHVPKDTIQLMSQYYDKVSNQ